MRLDLIDSGTADVDEFAVYCLGVVSGASCEDDFRSTRDEGKRYLLKGQTYDTNVVDV
jgi:hypothetical protein